MHVSGVHEVATPKHDRLIQRGLTVALLTLAATLVCAALVLYV
jgi:hypothetical protein